MTLRELSNALTGFNKLEAERHERDMIQTRIISFWAYRGHVGKKLRRYEQLFELPGDLEARRERLKGVKEVVIYDEQSNG
jgi:hypothetical protein